MPIVTRRRNAPLQKSNFKVVDRSLYLQTAALWNSMDIGTRNIDSLGDYKAVHKEKLANSIPLMVD